VIFALGRRPLTSHFPFSSLDYKAVTSCFPDKLSDEKDGKSANVKELGKPQIAPNSRNGTGQRGVVTDSRRRTAGAESP